VKRLFIPGLALWLVACAGQRAAPEAAAPAAVATTPAAPAAETWLTKLDIAHPLVGKVWDVRARGFVSVAEVVERAAAARFVLLGERHDNPDHHRLQARILEGLLEAGRRPTVVLEMLELEQQASVDQYLARPDATAAGFGAALSWQATSWPPFVEYQPIFEVALAAKLKIAAGNLAHATARRLVKEGTSALPAERVQALRLAEPFPEPLAASLADELRTSHCGHLPEHLLGPMALAQHARDAQMASVMLTTGASDGAVLIAGAGHTRQDRGAPYYLKLAAPAVTSLSIAMQEVAHGVEAAQAYGSEPQAFDYVWFTPRGSDEDPCAAFTKPSK
jgi:uncharacterized iron-regulated protein